MESVCGKKANRLTILESVHILEFWCVGIK